MLLSHRTSVKIQPEYSNIIGHMCYAASKLWNVCNYERRHYKDLGLEKYKDHLFAAAFNVCKNAADADDVVQDTFLQYHTTNRQFENEQHIRAWLIRVAINKAKNINLSFWRQKGVPLEEYMETLTFETPEAQTLFTEVMKLPEKYRIVIHLL